MTFYPFFPIKMTKKRDLPYKCLKIAFLVFLTYFHRVLWRFLRILRIWSLCFRPQKNYFFRTFLPKNFFFHKENFFLKKKFLKNFPYDKNFSLWKNFFFMKNFFFSKKIFFHKENFFCEKNFFSKNFPYEKKFSL